MCGRSKVKLVEHNVLIYMGRYGGGMSIGDLKCGYLGNTDKVTREESRECLIMPEKIEIVDKIIELLDNGVED